MATKAPAAKTTAVVTWKEKLAAAAQRTLKREAPSSAKNIKFNAAGVMVDGVQQPGGFLDVIILESMEANTFYPGDYDPDNPSAPECFAFGGFDEADTDSLVPHDDAADKQSKDCDSCEQNEWGSAAKGKGKACKNSRWLACIRAEDLEDIDGAELRIIKLPVTSVKVWNAYARNVLAVKMELPPYAVVTRCGSVPDPKSQYKATFTFEEEVEMTDALFESLQLRIKEAQGILQVPFAPSEPKPVAPPKNSKLTKGRK